MANESINKVGEFTVAPEMLISKADQIKTSLTLVSLFMKMIEDAFKGIEDEEIWQGPLAEKYFENAKNFFKGGATLDDDSTSSGYNTYSTNVLAYADKVYSFLNEASGGYLDTDTNVEKSVAGDDGSFVGPMPQETTGKVTEQEPTTSAANAATTVVGAVGVAGAQKKEEITNVDNSNVTIKHEKKQTSGESYDIPEGETYAKQIQSINSLSEKKNADGSYYYKASAIAFGGTDASGKKWNTKTEEGTGLRYVEEDGEKYYCAAMGTMYGDAGDKVKITTDSGQTFNVIITDSKSVKDAETVNINGETYSQYHYWGSGVKDLVELNCDYSKVPSNVKNMGSWHVLEQFSGNIESIEPIN